MIDYKKSGVDIQAGDQLVSWLEEQQNAQQNTQQESPHDQKNDQKNNHTEQLPLKNSTNNLAEKLKAKSDVSDLRKRVISGIGGFAALFDGRFQNMKKPLLVSCTDGVGTKVKLASYFNDYSTIGQDLVAMCANDLICTGGTPLFFLDYYAVGKLNLEAAQSFLTSVKKACDESHLVLIGGETAEMPGVYQTNDFDCAGFSVGVVDEDKMWGAHKVQEGDVILGLESSGFHSNGYSLIRKVFEGEFEKYKEWLLKPTRLYVEATLSIKADFEIHAAAHMTGGGIENLPRVLPEHLKAKIKKWPLPECFAEVKKRSGMSEKDFYETFNCGIGFVLIFKKIDLDDIQKKLSELNYKTRILGEIDNRKPNEESYVWVD